MKDLEKEEGKTKGKGEKTGKYLKDSWLWRIKRAEQH